MRRTVTKVTVCMRIQEVLMARGIDTKCLHLEEEEGQNIHYGAISYRI